MSWEKKVEEKNARSSPRQCILADQAGVSPEGGLEVGPGGEGGGYSLTRA